MGSGKSKTHESFSVTPSASAVADVTPAQSAPAESIDAPADAAIDSAATAHLDQAAAALNDVADAAQQPATTADDVAAQYANVVDAVHYAQQEADAAAAAGADASDINAAVKAASLTYLQTLSPEQLQALAGAHGFAHPHLVGLDPEASQHPLVHVLDPAYPDGALSKAKIAAKADERYAQLAAGATIGGLTFDQVKALEAGLAPPADNVAFPPWQATPSQALEAMSALATATVAYSALHPHLEHVDDRREALEQLLTAENTLRTAQCPQLGDSLVNAQAAAKAQVDSALQSLSSSVARECLAPRVAAALAAGYLTSDEHGLLSGREQLALLRASTGLAERTAITEAADTRAAELANYQGLHSKLSAASPTASVLTLPPLTDAAGVAAHTDFLAAAPQVFPAWAKVCNWLYAADSDVAAELGASGGSYYSSCPDGVPHTLTKAYQGWAKQQLLPALRQAAQSGGLKHPEVATRQQVTAYLASGWSASPSAAKAIQFQVDAKHAAKHAVTNLISSASTKAPTPTPSALSASAAPTSGGALVPSQTSAQSWSTKHLALVAALKHHGASTTLISSRHEPTTVASWTWTDAGAGGHLGGHNTKSLITSPDGSTWMFKPDKKHGGARSHAESAASRVFHAVGIPSVDVHVVKHSGHTGSAQPLLPGVSTLPAAPSAWSQADVDSIVRYHVGAWAISDHDGKPDNVLRTPASGLIPCDQGQAFKFFGSDQLSTSYTPSVSNAVYNVAYAMHKTGGLGAGVTVRPEAALPVLKAFEALPDSHYRDMLRSTAYAGVKGNVHWVPRMREAAAKKLGVAATAVTSTQVAEHFLDQAVARKATLRKDFTTFFAGMGFASGAAKLTHLR